MALTLAQLTNPGTDQTAQQQVLDGCAGRSIVTKTGTGTGNLAISGMPTAAYSPWVQISTAGEPGAAQYQTSLDGGTTWSTAAAVPSSGSVALGTTGVFLAFSAGPTGAGVSFVLGDLFTFALWVPALPSTAWQDGSVPKTLALIQGDALANQRVLIAKLAMAGFVTTQPGVTGASGSWLDLAGQTKYGFTRNLAVPTSVTVVLTDAGGAGPFTIAPGQLWVANTASLGGSSPLRYTNSAGGTLPQNGTLALLFQAESAAAAYNVADGTITTMLVTLPGVTCDNSGPISIVVQGADQETDAAYSLRCLGRWASLGTGSPGAAYDSWARTASAEVARTSVVADGTTAGQIDVYLAGSAGPVSSGAVTAVTIALTPKLSFPATLVVAAATATAVTVTATVNVFTANAAAAQAACEAALAALVASIPIAGTIYLSQILDALQRPGGVAGLVRNVTVSAPATDTVITAGHVATLAGTRTYVSV